MDDWIRILKGSNQIPYIPPYTTQWIKTVSVCHFPKKKKKYITLHEDNFDHTERHLKMSQITPHILLLEAKGSIHLD